MTSMAAALCLLLMLATSTTRAQSLMDHEPVEHLKAHLSKRGDGLSAKLEVFLQAPPKEMERNLAKMENNLGRVLANEAHVSAFFVKEGTVLAKRAAERVQFNSTFLLPHAVLLPILSTTLPILLEGFKPDLLTKPVGEVLKQKHRQNAKVKNYLSLSLHDLVTKLPRMGDSVDLGLPTLLSELDQRGRAALFYLNTVLDSVAEDAWRDALISVAMDHSAFSDTQQMLTHLKDLARYAEAVGNDIVNFYEVSKSDLLPLDGGHFLYGWWFNCPRTSRKTGGREVRCLAPFLPSDTMAVLHRAIRMYTIPRLSVHLLIANDDTTAEAPHTLSEVLEQDRLIWSALYSVVDPSSASDKPKETDKKKQSRVKEDKPSVKSEETEAESAPSPPPSEEDTDQAQSLNGDGEAPTHPPVQEKSSAPPEAAREPESSQEVPTEPPAAEEERETPGEKPQPSDMPTSTEPEPEPPSEPPSAEPEIQQASDPTAEEDKAPPKATPPAAVTEDEVVGDSMPKKPATGSSPSGSSTGQPSPQHSVKREEEDEVVEETRERTTREKKKEEKSLTVRAIYFAWPFVPFFFYTVFSHVWVYWILHLIWLVCSSLFPGIYLPRPKTAKQD